MGFVTLRAPPSPNLSFSPFVRVLGYYFIDRNGRLFEAVLDYLRSGELITPPHATEQQVRAELDFYSIVVQDSSFKQQQQEPLSTGLIPLEADVEFGAQIREKFQQNSVRGFLQKNMNRIKDDIKTVAPHQAYIQLVWCWSRAGSHPIAGVRFMGTDTSRPDCFLLNRLLRQTLGIGACSSSYHYVVDYGNREMSMSVYAIRVYWDLSAMERYISGENEAILQDPVY
jgi:hypothetical protein